MYKLLIPDLPQAASLLPWLERIDSNRQYSNFGPLVHAFEEACNCWLSETSKGPVHCASVNSGTAGLELALSALSLPAGSRVLVPALTFPATALAVVRAGHLPMFADVDPDTWELTPSLAEKMACDAVIPVSTYGLAQDPGEWDRFSERTGRPVIIDAASALGYQAIGEQVVVVFSLHATKPLGCGEGGLVASRSSEFVERVRQLSNFGFHASRSEFPGTNAKLSEYAAAVGLAQLERREQILQKRQYIWDAYLDALSRVEGEGIRLQAGGEGNPRSVMCLDLGREALPIQDALRQSGVESRRWYCPPLHEHPALAIYWDGCPLPTTQRLASSLLGLPFHNFLSESDVCHVVTLLKGALHL